MVWRKYLAKFDLAFKTVPYAVDYAKAFKKLYGAIGCSPVNCRFTALCDLGGGRWTVFGQVLKDGLAR